MAGPKLGKAGVFSVAEEDVDRWNSFIAAMEAAGYTADPTQSGGYNDRNIFGKNVKSQHSYGKAIDWNWTKNAEGTEGEFDPNIVGPIAAAHGLKWLRDRKDKPDPMHFEVASQEWTPFKPAPQMPQLPGMAALGVQPTMGFIPSPVSKPASPVTPTPTAPGKAPAMDPLDLSSFMPQAPTQTLASTPVRTGGGWTGWAQDPINQAALLSFGVKALTGSWGSPMQAFGEAAGVGLSAAQGQAEAERSNAASLLEKEAERETKLKVAETSADARVAAAEERGKNSLMRATLTAAAKTPEEQKVADAVYKKTLDRLRADQLLNGMTPQQMEAEARQAAQDALIAARVRRADAGAVPAEITSGNSVNAPAQGSGQGAGAKGATAPVDKNAQRWEAFKKQPGAAEKLNDPKYRIQLRTKFPELKSYIDKDFDPTMDVMMGMGQ